MQGDNTSQSDPDASSIYAPSEGRKSLTSSFAPSINFQQHRKTRQSFGAYTSLFARKLLPPLGFYRESDKYAQLKAKVNKDDKILNPIRFKDEDPLKAEAVDEMWLDYQKYQVRKRFRWPPNLFCKKFFWTTGYYADYQKIHRARKLRKPGEDSSDEEFFDPAGQYMVAGGEDDDINMEEFERYREAKKLGGTGEEGSVAPRLKRATRFNLDGAPNSYLVDRRPTVSRLFEEDEQPKKAPKEVEETETIVEYAVIRDPNKKKKDKGKKKDKDKDKDSSKKRRRHKENEPEETFDGLNLEELQAGVNKKHITRRKSVAILDPTTGEKVMDIEESTEVLDGTTGSVREKSRRKSQMKL